MEQTAVRWCFYVPIGAAFCRQTQRSSDRPGSKPSRIASLPPSVTREKMARCIADRFWILGGILKQVNKSEYSNILLLTFSTRSLIGSHPHQQAASTPVASQRRDHWKARAPCRRSWPSQAMLAAVTVVSQTPAGPASTWASPSVYSALAFTGKQRKLLDN